MRRFVLTGCWVVLWALWGVAGEDVYTLAKDNLGATLKGPDGRVGLRYATKKAPDSPCTANSACFFHPVNTPSGVAVTDHAPDDHRHHRGVFLAWYAVRGGKDADFWGWGQFAPTKGRVIENRSIELAAASKEKAELAIKNAWLADGDVMLDEDLTASVRQQDAATVVDLTYKLTAAEDTKLDQSAFAGFCARLRKDGKCGFAGPEGEVKLPNPHYLKPETCWPAADWYDYTIALNDGKTVGMAIIDHPTNPPAKWHNNRGVWMLNPCITAPGPLVLKKGQPLALRYRLVAHDGPTPSELLKSLAAEWRKK